MNLYYELIENGYLIKDRDNAMFKIKQYEPHIPYRANESDKNYQKYAQVHIDMIIKEQLEAEREKVTLEQLQIAIEEQNTMIIDNTYRVTMLELMQNGISL